MIDEEFHFFHSRNKHRNDQLKQFIQMMKMNMNRSKYERNHGLRKRMENPK